MLLAIDQGNSDVVFGLHNGTKWIANWRTPTAEKKAVVYEGLMRQWLLDENTKPSDIDKVVISSVVPEFKKELVIFADQLFGSRTLILSAEVYDTLKLELNSPHEIGSDLVANAVAAGYHFPKQHCIVVDFGTALTFTSVIDKQLLGVTISPGLKTAMKSLFHNTAQLPEVPLEVPQSVLGKDTIHAIQAGVLTGYIGLVKHLLEQTSKELGSNVKVIATGGLNSILKPLHQHFDLIDEHLTLEGLRIINEQYLKLE